MTAPTPSLPKWILEANALDYCPDADCQDSYEKLVGALAIAHEALEKVGYAQGDGHPLALMRVCREALRRIRELGETK